MRWPARAGLGRHGLFSRRARSRCGACAAIGRVPTCTCVHGLDRCRCPTWSGPVHVRVRVCVRVHVRVHVGVHVVVRVRSAHSSPTVWSAFERTFPDRRACCVPAPRLPREASAPTKPCTRRHARVRLILLRNADSACTCTRARARAGSACRSGAVSGLCACACACSCVCTCARACARAACVGVDVWSCVELSGAFWSCLELSGAVWRSVELA